MKRAFSRKNMWENLPQGLKSSIGRVAGLLPPDFFLGGDFRYWYGYAMNADTWSAEQVAEHQLEEVRKICLLARDRSEYYRETFSAAGFEPEKMRSLSELTVLPLIDKHTIIQEKDRIMTCAPDDFNAVREALEAVFGAPEESGLVWKPQNLIPVDDVQAATLLKLLDVLDDNDDVQTVSSNFDIPEDIIAKLA